MMVGWRINDSYTMREDISFFFVSKRDSLADLWPAGQQTCYRGKESAWEGERCRIIAATAKDVQNVLAAIYIQA